MKKRVLSLFMAFVLCLTLLPTAAIAEEPKAVNGTAVQAAAAEVTESSVASVEINGTTSYYDTLREAIMAAGEKAGSDGTPPTITLLQDGIKLSYPQYNSAEKCDDPTYPAIVDMSGNSLSSVYFLYDTLTLTGGTVNGTWGVDVRSGGSLVMTAPEDAEAAVSGPLKITNISGQVGIANVSGAKIGVKGTLRVETSAANAVVISGSEKAVELDSEAYLSSGGRFYGSAEENGSPDTVAVYDADQKTYMVNGETVKKLVSGPRAVVAVTPGDTQNVMASDTQEYTAQYTAEGVVTGSVKGLGDLQAEVENAADNHITVTTEENAADGTWKVTVQTTKDTPKDTYTLKLWSEKDEAVSGSVQFTVSETQYAASVGEQEYRSLSAAIDAVKDTNGTVKLLDNVTSSITVTGGKFTIDLNGKTWTGASDNYALTVDGGEVTVSSTGGTGMIVGSYANKHAIWINGGTVHLKENVKLEERLFIDDSDGGSVTFEPGVTVTKNIMTASRSVVRFLDGLALQNASKAYVPFHGVFTNEYPLGYVTVVAHPNHNMVDGVCGQCGYVCGHSNAKTEDTSCLDCGATFIAAATAADGTVTRYTNADAALAAAAGNARIEFVEGTYTLKNVAKLYGSTEIDLNGATLQYASGYYDAVLWMEDSFISAIIKNGTIRNTGEGAGIYLYSGSTLTLENVTVTGGTDTSFNTQQEAVHVTGNNTLTVKSGDFTGPLYAAAPTGNTVKLYGGTYRDGIKSYDQITADGYAALLDNSDPAKQYAYADGANGTVISYATVAERMNDRDDTNNSIQVVEHTHAMGDASTCTECGFVCTAHRYENGVCVFCHAECPHTDATCNVEVWTCDACGLTMVARVSHGDDPDVYAADLAAAMNNAADGTTFTLLVDVTLTGNVKVEDTTAKTLTLDLQGHTIRKAGFDIGETDVNKGTAGTLKITGTGSLLNEYTAICVWEDGALDLTGWSGGTISSVGLGYNTKGSVAGKSEPQITVGADAGRIGSLMFGNWYVSSISASTLEGGSYDQITMNTDQQSVNIETLLPTGYAFQKNDGTLEKRITTIADMGAISNVSVVECTHAKVVNGTCAYCGKTGIAATLGTEIYTENNIAQAFNYDWQTIDGATLTLHQDCSVGNIGWYGVYNGTLDLNGHTLTMAENTSIEVSGGSSVTVVDSSENGGGKLNGRVWISSGSLTLESGEITSLDASNVDSTNVTLKLHGGKVKITGADIPMYKLLEEGYYLLNGSVPVEPSGKLDTSVTYTVQKADITVASGITGEIAISKNRVPISMTVFAGDRSLKYVRFQWYLLQDDGTLVQLTKSADEELYESFGSYATVYDCNKPYGKEFASAWNGLEVGKTYKLLCVLTGKDDSGDKWHTVLKGCTMTMLPPSLEDAEITFADGWRVRTFWPDFDNNSIGKTEISSAIGAYTVTLGGKTLTEGTDYTVSGNVATGIGLQELTITGIAPNYSGTQTVQWEVVPHTLAMLEIKQISKPYDGTVGLPDGAFSEYFNSANGYGHITLQEGTDYVVTEARFDTPDASDQNKVYRYTVKLKNPNYVFEDGTSVRTAVYGESAHTTVSITKADAPAAESDALTILNDHADTYTVDLPALPALTSPMEYGEVSYTINWVDLGSYYNVTKGEAKIENGKLILPIQAVATKTEGSIGEVAVMVSSTNIADFALIINVSATNKIVPTGAPTLSKATLVWGEALTDITLSGTMRDEENGKDVTGTFAWDSANVISGIGRLSMAWTFTPDDTNTYTEEKGSSEVEVVKATPAGAPKYTAITASGKTLADASLTVEGGTFSIPGTVQWVDADGNALAGDTEVKANTAYKWRFVPEDAEHYNELTGSITLYSVSTGGGGGSGSVSGKTETVTNPDGSVTKTETKSDGTVIETTTNTDGSVSKTESKTTTKSDGSTVETVTETNTNADGSKSTSKTETTTNKDGSKTETKSETKTEADGTKSETKSETKTDANGVTNGKETTKTTAPNGSTGTTTTTTENGNTKTEAEAKVSEKAVEDAKKSGEAVKVPTEVKAGEDSNSAPTVKVELPKDAGETKIEIPVSDVNSGTVAVIVHPDGTEEIVKDSKPTEDGIQLTVDGSATVKIIDNSKDFIDTRDHWSRDEVNFVASREIFNGVGGNRFGVDQPMTRGMVNTVLARLAGVDTTPKNGQKWYEVGTAWAKANGITDGTNPEASVTREQLATLLYRFSGTPEVNGALSFSDAHEVSGYAENALIWATQNGILNGVGSNRVAPGADAQRAQVAAMMARYLKNVG